MWLMTASLSTLALFLNNPMNKSALKGREFRTSGALLTLRYIGLMMAFVLQSNLCALFHVDID
jgi:hypothetical protein